MSLTAALSVALSGIKTSTTAAQIISGNIANAQTEGYTKKGLSLSAVSLGTDIGGVQISGYTRVTNAVLQRTLFNATSSEANLGMLNGYMMQIQSMLDSTGDPPALTSTLNNFQASLIKYSSDPSNEIIGRTVVAEANNFANTIRSISNQLATLERDAKSDMTTSVSELNVLLQQVQNINDKITATLALKQPIGNLQDERDVLISKIAEVASINVLERHNGQIAIYTNSGLALLDGQPQRFSVGVDGVTVMNAAGSDVTIALTGGKLQAITAFLSDTGEIAQLKSQLQNLVLMFVAETPSGNSFADVYNAAGIKPGELPDSFFKAVIDPDTGLPNIATFSVNPDLLNGTFSMKSTAATDLNNVLNSTNAAIVIIPGTPPTYDTSDTFQSIGLNVKTQTFSGITATILSGFQQIASSIQIRHESVATQKQYYSITLSNQTGVNTDEELINLTNWQNSYAASAHVVSVIQKMLDILQNMVR
ncbi:MAG: flagellar hook-associated protein FlgK [Alphaproteobacteria bacterium]|nr:flagellar hook-associated protein FlgK [Alphaproteobacteria bacterium]MCL2505211.1 flagellar hook-associated protein FlgK [Alphaproteobacteria bacterium]